MSLLVILFSSVALGYNITIKSQLNSSNISVNSTFRLTVNITNYDLVNHTNFKFKNDYNASIINFTASNPAPNSSPIIISGFYNQLFINLNLTNTSSRIIFIDYKAISLGSFFMQLLLQNESNEIIASNNTLINVSNNSLVPLSDSPYNISIISRVLTSNITINKTITLQVNITNNNLFNHTNFMLRNDYNNTKLNYTYSSINISNESFLNNFIQLYWLINLTNRSSTTLLINYTTKSIGVASTYFSLYNETGGNIWVGNTTNINILSGVVIGSLLPACNLLSSPFTCNANINCTWNSDNLCIVRCSQFDNTSNSTCQNAFDANICKWNTANNKCNAVVDSNGCFGLDQPSCLTTPNCTYETFANQCMINCFQYDFTNNNTCSNSFGGSTCKWESGPQKCNPIFFDKGYEGFSFCFNYDGNKTGCDSFSNECIWFSEPNCLSGNKCRDKSNGSIHGSCNLKGQMNYAGQCYTYDGNKTGCESTKLNFGWDCSWRADTWGPKKPGMNESGWCNTPMMSISTGSGGGSSSGSSASGCWAYNTNTTCLAAISSGMPCEWKNSSSNTGWCEQKGCWNFNQNQTRCENDTVNMGLKCKWGGGNVCYEDFSSGCTSYNNNQLGCTQTGHCVWNTFNSTCSEPINMPLTQLMNPKCGIFNPAGVSKCNNVTVCNWNNSQNKCLDNTTSTTGVQCSNIIDSTMCNSIPILSSCCSWNGTSCNSAPLKNTCYQMKETPNGAKFCNDYNSFKNQTLCEMIANEPWYMPCEWKNTTIGNRTISECKFKMQDMFNTPSGSTTNGFKFNDLSSKQTCEASSGVWKEKQLKDISGQIKSEKWCDMAVGVGHDSCDNSCWACEHQANGSSWQNLLNAQTACESSLAPSGCIFHSDNNSMNGLGWCGGNISSVVRNFTRFVFENCFGFVDMDGDGLTPDKDPDCYNIKKFGFVKMEKGMECNDGIDNDQNGQTDCNDSSCYNDFYAISKGYCNATIINDTTPPSITKLEFREFQLGGFLFVNTDEPSNFTLNFYSNNDSCTILNQTMYDFRLENNYADDDYSNWHDLPLDQYNFDRKNINYTIQSNTTYYYKIKLCDKYSNCLTTTCTNFTTASETKEFFIGFNLPPPQDDITKALGTINVQLDFGNTGNFNESISDDKGLMINDTQGRNVNIKFTNPNASSENNWSIKCNGADIIKAQDFNITEAFKVNKTENNDSLVGMDSDKWEEMGQNLGCDTLEIIIPQGVENESNTLIKHCPEDVTELNDTRCASFNITDSTVNCSYTSNYTTCIVSPTVWFSVFGVYESVASIINNVASSSSSGSSGSSGGSSGSSSGGSGGSNNFQILYFGNITNQSTTQLTNQNYSLTELTLNVNVPVKDVKVFIEKKKTISTSSNNISQELGSPYQFFTLTSPQITDKEISSAKIKFKVENSWLKENNFNASRIFLLRYNGVNWIEETTILTSKDLDYAYFEAETRYLGEYSISYIEPNELAYILMASLNPILDDLKAVIESGLSDAMLIDKIGTYLSGKLDVPKTLKLSKELVNDLKISRKVSDTATLNLSKMSVSIKNNKNDSISFLYVEAVPKSLVHDIYFLKNFKPRIYDIIIREDPVIQWSFGEADTSIVAWEIKDLKPGDTAEFSYELDVKIDVTKYPAPIIIKPTVTLSTNVRAEEKKEDLPINENTEESVKKNKKLSIILTTLLILSIIGAVLSVFIKNKKNKNKSNEFKDNETNKTSNEVEKLSKYIEKEKSKGKTENDIKHALENVGWDDETINKGFLNKK